MKGKKLQRTVKVILILFVLYKLVTTFSINTYKSTTEYLGSDLEAEVESEIHTNWLKYGAKYHPNVRAKLPKRATVRQQLSYQFPYEPTQPFQKNIWQTWKVGVDHPDFPRHYKSFQLTWETMNPGYNHFIFPDDMCHDLIGELYKGVPDVALAYQVMPKSILKADFFRYLILFAKGGVYSDIDTKCLKPVDDWAPMKAEAARLGPGGGPNLAGSVGLVVGIEADPDRVDWAEWYARRIQFCQWTIMAKRGHPMLRELIARITNITLIRKKNGQLNKVLGKDSGGDIMNWTGPGIWTDLVFEYMNNIKQSPESFELKQYKNIIDWKTFANLKEPKPIEDVVVLPITSFSPGVNQMGAKGIRDPMAYAEHTFLGSWKPH